MRRGTAVGVIVSGFGLAACGPPPVALFQDQGRPLEDVRDEFLLASGYPEDVELLEQAFGSNAGVWVYRVPATDTTPEPAQALIAIRKGHDVVVATTYEVHPNAWRVIVDTLVDSAKKTSILAP